MMWLVDIDFYMRVLAAGAVFAYSEDPLVSIISNAEHQLTKYCRENEEIELRESMLMFSKIEKSSRYISEITEMWFSLFERFHIHSLLALKKYHGAYPELRQYFLDLLNRYRHQRYFTFTGLKRLFSSYSSLLPEEAILGVRRMKHRLSR